MPQMNATTTAVGILVALGILGVIARPLWGRIILWVLAVPSLVAGCLVLAFGGIAEPFTKWQIVGFCTLTFWPAIGCTIGQALSVATEEERDQDKKNK